MSKFKGTLGPLGYVYNGHFFDIGLCNTDGSFHRFDSSFASVYPDSCENYDEAEAIARLLSAAPDLLQSLQAYLAWNEDSNRSPAHFGPIKRQVYAALAKALGEQS